MKRKIVVAGNWKMNLNYEQAIKLMGALAKEVSSSRGMEVIVCPPYPYLIPIVELLKQENRDISIGGQNCHHEEKGAFTGEVSAQALASTGAKYVILGHSERRAQFNEDEALLRSKLKSVLSTSLDVMFCVGESLSEREGGNANDVVAMQVREGLKDLSAEEMSRVSVAYEPVWAIGTGKTATPDQAQDMHAHIRQVIAQMAGEEIAAAMSILYGGSVKPANALEIFSQPDVDGGLVGGASLDEHQFIAIVRAAQSSL